MILFYREEQDPSCTRVPCNCNGFAPVMITGSLPVLVNSNVQSPVVLFNLSEIVRKTVCPARVPELICRLRPDFCCCANVIEVQNKIAVRTASFH
jgi:hypothetical protein